jgi:hypothetical protein
MKRYEVRIIPDNTVHFEKLLNTYSEAGWEVLAINGSYVIFVKEKEEE